MQIEVKVLEARLDDVVHEENDYRHEVTLGDLVVQAMIRNLVGGEPYGDLRRRIVAIRDDEIRDQVRPLLEAELQAGIQQTNEYGEPTGKPAKLRDLLVQEARQVLTRKDTNRGGTLVEQIVRAEVQKAMREELTEAIKVEREKVVAAVRAEAADLIAQAVKRGLGGF